MIMAQKMTIWEKSASGWNTTEPDFNKLTPDYFAALDGQPIMIHWQDVHMEYYAHGTADMKRKLEDKYPGKAMIMFDMPSFGHYWQYKLLEFGIDTFCRVENAEERLAVMTAEGETEEAAAEYMETRPDLYQMGIEWPDDF